MKLPKTIVLGITSLRIKYAKVLAIIKISSDVEAVITGGNFFDAIAKPIVGTAVQNIPSNKYICLFFQPISSALRNIDGSLNPNKTALPSARVIRETINVSGSEPFK